LTPPPAPRLDGSKPRLRARLSKGFDGDILALESEDHYVRVHGVRQSELLLLRLRDAIQEMDGCPGAQTHRSWWVARDAVAGVVANGRNREIRLVNGMRIPVARDSVFRLEQAGFLPATSQPEA
jgi:DNA-binding LytR/AlgR family response regulator